MTSMPSSAAAALALSTPCWFQPKSLPASGAKIAMVLTIVSAAGAAVSTGAVVSAVSLDDPQATANEAKTVSAPANLAF